jgi:hypothetical protein
VGNSEKIKVKSEKWGEEVVIVIVVIIVVRLKVVPHPPKL